MKTIFRMSLSLIFISGWIFKHSFGQNKSTLDFTPPHGWEDAVLILESFHGKSQ